MDIINELPSHEDQQFVQLAKFELTAACVEIESAQGTGLETAEVVAVAFEQAKEAINSNFDRHYDDVLSSLSQRGQNAIRREVNHYSGRNALVRSDLDFRQLSQLEPEYTVQFLKATCQNVRTKQAVVSKETLLLKDDFIRAFEAGSATVKDLSTIPVN